MLRGWGASVFRKTDLQLPGVSWGLPGDPEGFPCPPAQGHSLHCDYADFHLWDQGALVTVSSGESRVQ